MYCTLSYGIVKETVKYIIFSGKESRKSYPEKEHKYRGHFQLREIRQMYKHTYICT